MPIHDWTRVDAGTFHHFHKRWISAICDALNNGLLPTDYYVLDEQYAAAPGPELPDPTGVILAPPRVAPAAEAEDGYLGRRNAVAVRHVSGDRIVAVVEVVSHAHKAGRHGLRSFVEKASELLGHGIHLLILDLHPPGPRDPHGIHAAVWEDYAGQPVAPPDRPLFLVPNGCVEVPLEATYAAAFAAVPRRWRDVLEPPAAG